MIDWLVVSAAFLTGLMGGVHCAAMCGGIATSLSINQRGGWWKALQPNLGRILGYTLAGAIVGGFGAGLLHIARIDALTTGLRAAVGIVLILVALRLFDQNNRLNVLQKPARHFWRLVKPIQSRLLPADTALKRFALGLLWGWLPCGLSTTLLGAAWLQASAWHGALTMFAFGLGTLFVMVPLTWAGARIGQRFQQGKWRKIFAAFILLAGLLTLLAPWLMHIPALHTVLEAMGCRSLPV